MLNIGRKPVYLGILALIQLIGIALFCKGFFPYKIYLSGYATKDDMPSSLKDMHNEPEFDRLVFVVIDALRNDFIMGQDSGFDFVNSQIQRGAAYPFTAKATAPTVTMPRIKAMTTGTIPSFLDAILNIAESDTSSSLDFHDNWVYQLKNSANKTIHFFGDDTWIRLFPGLFDKMDGTTSFFVSDTVQVDLNVTRHIKTDLVENDWDAVIFHYLGLDHIGHLGGPNSPLMKPKQREMDQAIESIYEIISKQDAERMTNDSKSRGTLIVVCGDHGMNEKGNHGGSSIGETSAALVFLSPRFDSRPSIKTSPRLHQNSVMGHPIIDQIDIVPTLATLFGFPIPKNNLGKVIYNLHGTDNVKSILHGLSLNAYQLAQLLSRLFPEVSRFIEDPDFQDENSPGRYYSEAIQCHEKYIVTGTDKDGQDSVEAYYKFIDIAQSYLSKTSSDYSLNLMSAGVALILCSAIGFTVWATRLAKKTHVGWNVSKVFCMFFMLAYSASMFSSSFVEEEHMTWYYTAQTVSLLSVIHILSLPMQTIREKWYPTGLCIAQLILIRIVFSWSSIQVDVLSCNDVKWHLMVLALATALVAGVRSMKSLEEKHAIDVNQTASIIQNIVKAALVLISVLNSILVLVYKIQTEGTANAPEVYNMLLNWELVRALDQVQLGKLIFNYQGAGIFVLYGLFYVTKRASLLTMGETSVPERKTSLFLQLLLHLSTPILILLSEPQNAFLFVIFNLQLLVLLQWQKYLAGKSPVPVWLISVIVSCLSHVGFFLTGHNNSIASIDLSNAYVGVQEYDTLLIGILTFCSNWSTSIWWAIAGWALIESIDADGKEKVQPWLSYIVTQSTLFSLVLGLLSMSVTILREHLFIWTVFSPKYLYQVAWTVLYHWAIQVCLGTIFTQVLFKWEKSTISTESIDSRNDL